MRCHAALVKTDVLEEPICTPKCGFLQEPHGVTTQKRAVFIVTAMRTSDLNLPLLHIYCTHSIVWDALCKHTRDKDLDIFALGTKFSA
jgi:hypothetical protein